MASPLATRNLDNVSLIHSVIVNYNTKTIVKGFLEFFLGLAISLLNNGFGGRSYQGQQRHDFIYGSIELLNFGCFKSSTGSEYGEI